MAQAKSGNIWFTHTDYIPLFPNREMVRVFQEVKRVHTMCPQGGTVRGRRLVGTVAGKLPFFGMSQLPCSFPSICVECLSSRVAGDWDGTPFLSNVSVPVVFPTICVECLSSRAHFCCRCRFLRMSQLACLFLLICVECLSSHCHF